MEKSGCGNTELPEDTIGILFKNGVLLQKKVGSGQFGDVWHGLQLDNSIACMIEIRNFVFHNLQ
jgi:hypothetical protein